MKEVVTKERLMILIRHRLNQAMDYRLRAAEYVGAGKEKDAAWSMQNAKDCEASAIKLSNRLKDLNFALPDTFVL